MRKKPFSIFVVTILLLTMLLGAVQFGSGGASTQTDAEMTVDQGESGLCVLLIILVILIIIYIRP